MKSKNTDELLSIAIPTWNRAGYLKELLDTIEKQIYENKYISDHLKVYVFDNASTDDTSEVVKESNLDIVYKRNSENTGARLNIYQAYTAVRGKYVWVICDDELLPKKAIGQILHLIDIYNPGLILAKNLDYNNLVRLPLSFRNYREFSLFAEKHNPHLLIAHSLVSANIVLKSCFDSDFALQMMKTYYGNFYGVIKGLKKHLGRVLITPKETLKVRKARAPIGLNSQDYKIYIKDLEEDQIRYLEWLKKEYNLKTLMPENVFSEYYLRSQPVRIRVLRRIYNSPYRPMLALAKSLYGLFK